MQSIALNNNSTEMTISIKSFINKDIITAITIVTLTAFFSIVSSLYGFGLLSAWPAIILSVLFFRNYELGLLCFVLSFGLQAPVVFAPQFGQSATVRLDELVFASLFIVWMLKKLNKTEHSKPINPSSPETFKKIFILYLVIAAISLIPRFDQFNSTSFLNTATGLKGFLPLCFKLAEVIIGYRILADVNIASDTKKNMFVCLLIVPICAVIIGLLVAFGFLPLGIVNDITYDPYYYYTRLSVYGNTSAWGVLLSCYFFLLLYVLLNVKNNFFKIIIIILEIFCLYEILLSGTKTAMHAVGIGLLILFFFMRHRLLAIIKIIFIFAIMGLCVFYTVDKFATDSQKDEISHHLETAITGTGIKGFEKAYSETSLIARGASFKRFLSALDEEPAILIFGRGWQRRAGYINGTSLHNDILQATHDLGLVGAFYIIWLMIAMLRNLKENEHIYNDENYSSSVSLYAIAKIIAIVFIISSFASENLTLYSDIDVQFPFIMMLMAVTWNFWNNRKQSITS